MSKKYKCPYCNRYYKREDLIAHIENLHEDNIPVGFTPMRVAFNAINYPNNMDYNGRCTECGGPTQWDENKGRYDRQCGKKSCHDSYIKNFEANMMRTKGVTRITQTIDGQEMMLANRGISNKYKFSDGVIKTYTGSYEGRCLKFMDKVLYCKSIDVFCPGFPIQYEFNGEMHWYIPDIYYAPYNLIIEIKDGGDKPNNRNMVEYRAKQIAKEQHIIKNTDFNYLRLTNNDFGQLLTIMAELKLQLVERANERVININENMFAATQGMFPMKSSNSVYVINYMKNNTFLDDGSDFAISDSPKFDTVFYRNESGILEKGNYDILENTTYDLYVVENCKDKFESAIRGKVGSFVEYGFLYECIFNKPLYTADQIKFESSAEPAIDLYTYLNEVENMVYKYIKGNDNKSILEAVEDISRSLAGTQDIYGCEYIPNLAFHCDNEIRRYMFTMFGQIRYSNPKLDEKWRIETIPTIYNLDDILIDIKNLGS